MSEYTEEQLIKICNFAYSPDECDEDTGNVEVRTCPCGQKYRVLKTKKQDKCYFCLLTTKGTKMEQLGKRGVHNQCADMQTRCVEVKAPIFSAADELRNCLAELSERVNLLCGRLDPVLTPPIPQKEGPNDNPVCAPPSEICLILRQNVCRVHDMIARLDDVNERLEL